MKAELYSFLLENKFKNGVMYIKSMHEFVIKYDMAESVEEESLMRGFQRCIFRSIPVHIPVAYKA